MVKSTFTYTFEELPLFTLGPRLVAGLVDGSALIGFDSEGNWTVDRLWVDAAYLPKISERGRVESVELDAASLVGAAMFNLVRTCLDHQDRDTIQARVDKALAEWRADA